MKLFRCFIVLILLSTFCFAQQNYYNTHFDFHQSWAENGLSILNTDSGSVIAFGTTDTLGYNGILKTGLLFLSDSGSIQDYQIYTYPANYLFPGGFGALIKLLDNSLVLPGTSQSPTNKGQAVLTKFDQQQNILWQKTYGDSLFQSGFQCKQTRDGGFILVGQTGLYNPQYDDDILLIKTDSLGNMLWQKYIGGNQLEAGLAIDTCFDGGFIIGGCTLSYGVGANSNFGNGYIIKTDSLGNMLWSRTFGDIYDDGIWNGISLSDGGYAFCGYYTFYDQNYSQNVCCSSESKLYIIRLDSVNNIVWEKFYGPIRSDNQLYSIKELPNHGFIAAGWYLDTLSNKIQGALLRLDENGDTIWAHGYEYYHGNNSSNYLYDVVQDRLNGFTATGFIVPSFPDTGQQDIWVLRVDSNGCESTNCLVNAVNEQPTNSGELMVFPNPTPGKVKFTLDPVDEKIIRIRIYNLSGQIVYEQNYNDIDLSEFTSGIYCYEVITSKQKIFRGKIIKN